FGDYRKTKETETPTGSLFVATPTDDGLWDLENVQIENHENGFVGGYVLAIGRDNDGELYVLTTNNPGDDSTGKVYRIEPPKNPQKATTTTGNTTAGNTTATNATGPTGNATATNATGTAANTTAGNATGTSNATAGTANMTTAETGSATTAATSASTSGQPTGATPANGSTNSSNANDGTAGNETSG